MSDQRKIVIVGGVAGGASAAARARRLNETAEIIMLEKDDHVSFANCGLPYYIGGEIQSRDKLLVAKPEKFRDWFDIDVRTRHRVVSIDRSKKVIIVHDRDQQRDYEQAYDKLILAPGAEPLKPPIPGLDSTNVFTLRNLADTDAITGYIDAHQPKHVAVIGAGYIGLEMVEMLRHRGMNVSLVELLDQVMPPLDAEMARFVQSTLDQHDVSVHLGTALDSFEVESDTATAVKLNNGKQFPIDMAIVGIGVRPAVQLAAESGLELGAMGGITVNEYLQTTDPDIYAVGDAVEYQHGITQTPMRIPLAGPANRAGRIAGEHAAADEAPEMGHVMGTAIVRVFETVAGSTGLNEKLAAKLNQPARAVWIGANNHAGYYPGAEQLLLKLIYDPNDGRVLGAQAVGGAGVDKRIDVIATAMHFKATVDDLCNVDLAYAPPFGAAKDPIHMAAFNAQNDLRGIVKVVGPDEVEAMGDAVQILDVRNPNEWDAGHIDNAVHIPLDQLRERHSELNRDQPVVTYCQVGQRGYYAARILMQHGFTDVSNLSGGWRMQMPKHRELTDTGPGYTPG